jgi:hypothetical protein
VEPVAVVSTGRTRWRTALSHPRSIIVLAVGSACASQRLEEDGALFEAIQQVVGIPGHGATMVARR